MIRFRHCLAVLAFAGTACETITDPALPEGAVRLIKTPAVYEHWWAMTEACSGLQRDFSAVTWYIVNGASTISAGSDHNLAGYYSPASNRIVLADTVYLNGAEIRHEMLHALLGPSVRGHPRNQFLGRCAGTVDCVGSCLTDAGPPPKPDPAAVAVDPSALEVSGVVDPGAPSNMIDDGWFTFTIMVTNPRATPVVVTLAPADDGGPPVSFSWDVRFLTVPTPAGDFTDAFYDARADDIASATRFAAGETKRFVADYRVGGDQFLSMPPGTHVFTGYYNGRHTGLAASVPDTVTLGP